MEFLLAHLEAIIGLILGLILPAWKAYKAGSLNAFMVKEMKKHLPDENSKEAMRAKAIAAGVEPLLNKVVKKVAK